jgi:hypothetical protein
LYRAANSDYSPCGSKTKLFHIEFSDLHVSIEDSVKRWCDQLICQLFEAEYLADEDSVLVPTDVTAIRILAPIIGIRRKTDKEAEKDPAYRNKSVLVGFRNA